MKRAAALGTVWIVWGSTYLAVAVAERSLPPLLMLSTRFLLAGALLWAWSARRGELRTERPGRRHWRAAAIVGFLLLVVDIGGVSLAQERVPSGLAALVIASVPLFMAVIDRTFFGIRLPIGASAGIVTGLLGVGLLVGPGGRIDLLGTVLLLVAAFAWAAGSAYARVAPLPHSPLVAAAMQMLCAGVMLAGAGIAMGELSRVHPSAISLPAAGAFAFLVVFGSLITYTVYGWLIRNVSTQLLSTYAYVNPAVAVVLGWAILGEPIGQKEIAAGLLVLASVAMLLLARAPRPGAEPTAESLEGYIRAKDAQAVELRRVPRLAELRRIPA